MENNTVKERLGSLLAEFNLSQKKLAEMTKLTESAFSHYLKGDREPKGAILLNIANCLGTTTDYLTGKNDIAHPFSYQQEIEKAFELIARNAKIMSAEDKERIMKIMYKEGK